MHLKFVFLNFYFRGSNTAQCLSAMLHTCPEALMNSRDLMTQKSQHQATVLLFVIAYTEILMSLLFTVAVSDICLWLMNAVVFFLPNNRDCLLLIEAAVQAMFLKITRGGGWVTILHCEQFVTIFISLWSMPSFLLSLRALLYAGFVFTFWSLEKTRSASNFIPSPSELCLLNTSLCLWLIASLWLSGNSQVMLPVLTTAQNRRLITRK